LAGAFGLLVLCITAMLAWQLGHLVLPQQQFGWDSSSAGMGPGRRRV
jgi:hypothetical protein